MMRAGADFQSSTGGLSRLTCETCREETIHRSSACIHCGTGHTAYAVKSIAMLMRMGPDTRKKGA